MKNSFLILIFILLAGQLSRLGLPWWTLPLWGGLAGWMFGKSGVQAFFAGFLGGALLWFTAALAPDLANNGVLSGKIGQLFLGTTRLSILAITGFLGGLLSGLGCLSGFWARDVLRIQSA